MKPQKKNRILRAHAGESDGVDDMEEDSIDPPSMRIES